MSKLLILSGSLFHLKVLGLRKGRGVSSGAHMRRRNTSRGSVALRWHCRWPRARSNRQDGSTGWDTSRSGRGSKQLHLIKAFEEGLRSLGYRIGENVVIEYRFADGEMERLPALAADLVGLGVDVIVCGNNVNTIAAMKATTTIPIVMASSADPVSAGLVASLARPGGNVTGITQEAAASKMRKRLELLKEALPDLSRVGILWNPDFAPNQDRLTSMREAAPPLGLTLIPAEAAGWTHLNKRSRRWWGSARRCSSCWRMLCCSTIAARLASWPSEIGCRRSLPRENMRRRVCF